MPLLSTLVGKVVLLYHNQQGGQTPAELYDAAVLATSPLRYNVMNEGEGTTLVDSSVNAFTGSYTNVTWDGTLSPFGDVAAKFNGTTSFADMYSAAFAAAFDFDEFTIMCWIKMLDATVWTDATIRSFVSIQRDGSNLVLLRKLNTDNTLQVRRTGGGTSKIHSPTLSTPDWFCVGLSVSVSGGDAEDLLAAGESIAVVDGVQDGATQTGSIAATGTGIATTSCTLGAGNTSASQPHNGWMSRVMIWDRAIDADILALGNPT